MTTAGMGPFTHLLVVEGTSDQHAVFHLCRTARPGLEAIFKSLDARGFQGVLGTVPIYVNQEGMIAVGFVVDADDTPDGHWDQVINEIAIANNEINLPQAPDPGGTIIPENPTIGSPRIGIWVMPVTYPQANSKISFDRWSQTTTEFGLAHKPTSTIYRQMPAGLTTKPSLKAKSTPG